MRSAVGFGLIAAGLALGAHTLVRVAQAPDAARPATRTFSALQDGEEPAKGSAKPPVTSLTSPPAERRVSAALIEVAPTRPIASPRASVSAPSGQDLTRALQRELRRTGCYAGKINGTWTQSTERAMKAFTERVNASLPVDRPDIVLLALLQGERRIACGACPAGQRFDPGGDCLPAAILARARGEAAKREPRVVAAQRPEAGFVAARALAHAGARVPPIEGRMGIGGPKPASAENSRPGALAVAAPSDGPMPQARPNAERRSARHRSHHLGRAPWRAHPPLRPMDFAYRPMNRLRGLAGLLFGIPRY
jgi:peptidoglycan hydrolase-like protein with peptidoglycan-binding domain